MRGIWLMLGVVGVIWLFGFVWVAGQIYDKSQFCVDERCFALPDMVAKLNFAALNALAFTWFLAPLVVIVALVPFLIYLVREIRRGKQK